MSEPITDVEREFVRAMFPHMSVARIAEKLGRSRTAINNIVRNENLRERCECMHEGGVSDTEAPDSVLGRLEELRDMLRGALGNAEPREMASLAREYRATMEAMEKIEGGSGDDAAAFDALAASIAKRMPS